MYLGWKEMEKSIPINEKYVKPVYPYWGLAYMITPESAKILTQGHIIRNIIPVDEYLPQKIEELHQVVMTTLLTFIRTFVLSPQMKQRQRNY